MRIAQLAPLVEAVPPGTYGGTERVVDWLCRELTARGHEVTLFASGDSKTAARIVPVAPRALRTSGTLHDPIAWHLASVERLRGCARDFDVIHSHLDYLPLPALRGVPTPVVTTLHGRLDVSGLREIYRHFPDRPLVAISDAQRQTLPELPWAGTIHHGLPVNDYPFGPGDGDFFLFLGRISPEKRPHVAIDVARRAGVRLVLAAKVDAADRAYHEERVRPLLGEPGIEFLGEVDHREKVELLGRCRALLFPVLWPEPFGLAMIEALACGAPVIARRCGSTPEVVRHGETGLLCDDDDALVRALTEVDRIDRLACRRDVEERFSSARMAADYEAVYRRVGSESATVRRQTA